MIMKRIILIIAFFVGLIPNFQKMSLDSAFYAVGQSMYSEGEYNEGTPCDNPAEPRCSTCNECYSIFESYCPYCFYYCNECGIHYEESARHEHRDDTPIDESKYLTFYMCGDCRYETMVYNSLYAHQTLYNHDGMQISRRLSSY